MEPDNKFEAYRITVDPRQSPMRLDKFLMDRMEKVSRNIIQNGIKEGDVLVNDKKSKSSYNIRPGDLIQVFFSEDDVYNFDVKPEDIPLDIRYEDDDLMVIYKPPGMVVHPGVSNWTGTLVNGLVHYMQSQQLPVMEGNQQDRPGLVHRIDKNTSGLLVVAKNEKAMTALAKQFFDHSIEREYLALVWGSPDPSKGTINAHIGRHPTDRLKQHVFPEAENGKHAVTHYEVLEDLYYVSLVKCRLETGRTHQIRVHLSFKGHPLFNDHKYGGDKIVKGTVFSRYKQFVNNCFKLLPRHALHARSLGFIHPSTGEKMYFHTELPDDMLALLEKWRHYVRHQKSKL
jgi:23S rRNA pseudouridine1911/1915/1917 synthase